MVIEKNESQIAQQNEFRTSNLMLKMKLSKLNLKQSILWAADKIAKIENGTLDIKKGQWLPWNLLIFIKYSARFARARKLGNERDIYNVYAYLDNHLRNQPNKLLEKTGDVFKFFLRLAHQQLPFQTRLTGLKYTIVRQHLFFLEFENEIIRIVGISSINFLKICFIIFVNIENGRRIFRLSDLTYLSESLKKDAEKFFKYASRDLEELSIRCRELKFDEAELYGYGLFSSKPFIKLDDSYVICSHTYFCSFFSYGLYDAVKSTKGGEFGNIFENYLLSELKRHFSNVILEGELKKIAGSASQTKVCDAVLETPKYIAMFEFKATELPRQIKQDPCNSFDLLRSTLIKGIAQGYSTTRLLNTSKSPLNNAIQSKRTVLFIVSYKETFLGIAEHYWASITPVLKSEHSIDSFQLLSPQDIFFISIDDFDWIMTLSDKFDKLIDMAIEHFARKSVFNFTDIIKKFVSKESR